MSSLARKLAAALPCALLAVGASPAAARTPADVHVTLNWKPCLKAPGFDCATADVPRDYNQPGGPTFSLAVTRLPARDQANRVGSLFVNYGGPGGEGVATAQAGGGGPFGPPHQPLHLPGLHPRGGGAPPPPLG